jgi:hypothetical protein
MISEIEYSSRRAEMGFLALAAIATDVILGGMVVLFFEKTFSKLDLLSTVAMIGFIFLVANLVVFLFYRESQKEILDTISFDIVLDRGDFDYWTETYKSIVKQVEGHLVRNRITFDTRLEGHRFGGLLVPYGKVFHLGADGLTLKVKRDKVGRGTDVARLMIGPVSGPKDPVARKLLNGLREELLLSEEKDRPDKKTPL